MPQDTDKVRKILDDWYEVKMEVRDTSLKGWNWGKAEVQGKP
jgi:structure-specific recognition protein 1